jgi:hypothetical protein
MTQLMVKCKNCGVELRAATQMNEEAFEAISIGNTNESCPNCKRTLEYNKSYYYFKYNLIHIQLKGSVVERYLAMLLFLS